MKVELEIVDTDSPSGGQWYVLRDLLYQDGSVGVLAIMSAALHSLDPDHHRWAVRIIEEMDEVEVE